QVHDAVVAHLRLRAKPDVLWLHVPNGGARDAKTGAILKRMGTLAGASDFLLWHQGNSFALELKAPGGRPTEAQLDFLARFNEAAATQPAPRASTARSRCSRAGSCCGGTSSPTDKFFRSFAAVLRQGRGDRHPSPQRATKGSTMTNKLTTTNRATGVAPATNVSPYRAAVNDEIGGSLSSFLTFTNG